MEQRKLISMVKYTLTKNDSSIMREQYAYFMEQTPNIGMFVPAKEVDGVWIVLEEPNVNYFKSEPFCTTGKCTAYFDELEEYNEAKKRVFFEGFEVIINYPTTLKLRDKNSNTIAYLKNEYCFYFIMNNESIKTIEELVKHNLQLTEQKAKELGL